MITREYIVGGLFRKRFRYDLTLSKNMGGHVEGWAEYKGLLESRFMVKATPEYHKAIEMWIRKVNS